MMVSFKAKRQDCRAAIPGFGFGLLRAGNNLSRQDGIDALARTPAGTDMRLASNRSITPFRYADTNVL